MRLGNLSNSVKIYENIDKDHKYQIYEEYIENDTYITCKRSISGTFSVL